MKPSDAAAEHERDGVGQTPTRRDEPAQRHRAEQQENDDLEEVHAANARVQHAVAQLEDALGARREAGVVRDDDEGGAVRRRQAQHRFEHLVRGVRVEVAGGLVGQHAGRLGHQRAREGAALALAAGELARLVLEPRAQADLLQHRAAPAASAAARSMRRMKSGIATFSSAVNSGSR